MALAAYATEYGDVRQLITNQLDLAGKVVKVLGCVEITKSISTETASVSLIIPFVQAFCLTLEKNDDSDREIRTMKADMLASFNRRYAGIETNSTLTIATLLNHYTCNRLFNDFIETIPSSPCLDRFGGGTIKTPLSLFISDNLEFKASTVNVRLSLLEKTCP